VIVPSVVPAAALPRPSQAAAAAHFVIYVARQEDDSLAQQVVVQVHKTLQGKETVVINILRVHMCTCHDIMFANSAAQRT
jgi:hypothetical protein